jgi:vitamin B12/bleomycin/antimicrobial peptide transport system ATP-binding/permease protein
MTKPGAGDLPIVEVVAESGSNIEPPPPEVVETDPELSPEEAEQVRKDYLLTRFWISARGFWGAGGDRLAWAFSIGLLILIVTNVGFQYGINVWNRAIFDAIEKRDAAAVFTLTGVFFPLAIGSVLLGVAQVYARLLRLIADEADRGVLCVPPPRTATVTPPSSLSPVPAAT